MSSMIRLVCGHGGYRRPVLVFAYDGPLPIPGNYKPRGRGATLELRCRYCGFAARPGDDGLLLLLGIAADEPRQRLDINPG